MEVRVPGPLGRLKFVPRELMRRRTSGRTLRVPTHLRALAAAPTPPGCFDGSMGRKVQYPLLGNDRLGDCYEADALHCVATWCTSVGPQPVFDEAAVEREYTALSGGDNGLGDDQVFPHWKTVGFQGHRILDDMTVDPKDTLAVRLGLQKFRGGSFTCALLTGWYDSPQPGQVWDVGMGSSDPNAGHAMHLSGYVAKGQQVPFAVPQQKWPVGHASPRDFYFDETWGFDTPVLLTPEGVAASDPEITVQFSTDMFDARGVAADGETYDQKAALWHQLGGVQLPPWPGGPVKPPAPTDLYKFHQSTDGTITFSPYKPQVPLALRHLCAEKGVDWEAVQKLIALLGADAPEAIALIEQLLKGA